MNQQGVQIMALLDDLTKKLTELETAATTREARDVAQADHKGDGRNRHAHLPHRHRQPG